MLAQLNTFGLSHTRSLLLRRAELGRSVLCGGGGIFRRHSEDRLGGGFFRHCPENPGMIKTHPRIRIQGFPASKRRGSLFHLTILPTLLSSALLSPHHTNTMKFIAVLLALYAMCASAFIAPSAGEFGKKLFSVTHVHAVLSARCSCSVHACLARQ